MPQPGKDKPRKIPVCPATGEAASSTDPVAWSTFDDALAAVALWALHAHAIGAADVGGHVKVFRGGQKKSPLLTA